MSQVRFEINVDLFEFYSDSKHTFILLRTTDTHWQGTHSHLFVINNRSDPEVTPCISATASQCAASETGGN